MIAALKSNNAIAIIIGWAANSDNSYEIYSNDTSIKIVNKAAWTDSVIFDTMNYNDYKFRIFFSIQSDYLCYVYAAREARQIDSKKIQMFLFA